LYHEVLSYSILCIFPYRKAYKDKCLKLIMAWKTYLVIYFGTENGKPSETAKKIESLGFVTTFGPVDFIYDWGSTQPTKEQVLALADKISLTLRGTGSVFNIDTHD
jgi:hypothetical protein